MAKTPVSQVCGNGLTLLESKLAANGKLVVEDQLDLLETRRQVLTQLWYLPIWQPLEELTVNCIGCLYFANLSDQEKQWLNKKGIFFTMQDNHGYNEGEEWYGLLQAQLNKKMEIIEKARWTHFHYFYRRNGVRKDQLEANIVELSEAIEFHLQEPGYILFELEYTLKETLKTLRNPRECQQINQLLQSFQAEEELLKQFFPLNTKLV